MDTRHRMESPYPKPGMSLPQAIDKLTLIYTELNPELWPETRDAVNLGIEAMKDIKRLRRHVHYRVQRLLPGETKD